MNDELSQRAAQVRRTGALVGIFLLTFIILVPTTSAEYRVHLDYDWEGDDAAEQDPQPKFENCFPCHGEGHLAVVKICEDCHLPDGAGPYKTGGDFALRADYEAPLVHEHYYGAADIDVDNQSYGVSLSTCFSFDPIVEGTCHGVSYVHRDRVGGYFAFNENWTEGDRKRDPHEYTAPASNLPDTIDCLFCHNQDSDVIRYAWGDAPQVNSTHSAAVNEECYRCHVEGGIVPASFHQKVLYFSEEGKGGEGTSTENGIGGAGTEPVPGNRIVIAGLVLLVFALAAYLLIRAKGGQK